ncbi:MULTISPECIES: SAM-dependent methyltransferase [unclassified Paenibacillus]|uniref:class I SAM-dependent methyltransferase n=1 Tax=unclassified Paenibacillus TaxID=185978 RepID=UPI001AEA0D76|nr:MULTISPECIES: SAM-dependent methyltransferase [unclassified Paenibacillus]MBP1153395.1 SAM-dependent methyltransferase [Paenibacillus sp. PvP091]MBP1171222.1 SAM-dependent methyltransferase [Paenibacillus sp. PvR098]MBP2442250.1 SAM-dependent methyltransferase [Paenibacillus sp. PvP052]
MQEDELFELIKRLLSERSLIQATLSQVRRRDPSGNGCTKVTVKPVELKGELNYQFSSFCGQKVLHENLRPEEAGARLVELFAEQFRQGLLQTGEADYQVLISKKGKTGILKKPPTKQTAEAMTHNRRKKYIIEEGEPVSFLIELGIMNSEGKVLAKKYDKFRQINRFLEMIADVLPYLPKGRTLQLVDFGCGKSYLTFAMYHYLKVMQGIDLRVIGLDLKEDVISHCRSLADRLGYDGLRFLVGDIAHYDELQQVDMVVTLHACDTATDAALEKAVRWGASVILSVPCCQHELFRQVRSEVLGPMLQHGILKERFSAIATDAIRAKLLELLGYRTQLLEFIDMEHTPKNILIRAVRSEKPLPSAEQANLAESYMAFRDFLQADLYLERAMKQELSSILQP